MAKSLTCESCGKRVEVDDRTFSRWMGGDRQFFCNDCKDELGLDDDDSDLA